MCKMCVCVCLGVFPTAAARLDRELVRERERETGCTP